MGIDGSSSDPLGATASTSLLVQDASGSLAVTATMGPTGEVSTTTLNTSAEPEESESSSLPSSKLSARDAALPPPQPPATDDSRPSAASESASAGSAAGNTAGESAPAAGNEQADNSTAQPQPSRMEHARPGGLPTVATKLQATPPGSVTEKGAGSADVAQHPTAPGSDESLDNQELLPRHADDQAEESNVLGSSPSLGSSPEGWSRTGRSPSLGWSPRADGEGSPSGERPRSGQWRELSGTMGKKYYEAFKNRNSLTYTQVAIPLSLFCCDTMIHVMTVQGWNFRCAVCITVLKYLHCAGIAGQEDCHSFGGASAGAGAQGIGKPGEGSKG